MHKFIIAFTLCISTSIYAQDDNIATNKTITPLYQNEFIKKPISESERLYNMYGFTDIEISNQTESTILNQTLNKQQEEMGLPTMKLIPPQVPSNTFLKGPSFPQTNEPALPVYGNKKLYPTNSNNPYTIVPW